METTIHIHRVDGLGWLPTITVGETEVYRGEFRPFTHDALDHALEALERMEPDMEAGS